MKRGRFSATSMSVAFRRGRNGTCAANSQRPKKKPSIAAIYLTPTAPEFSKAPRHDAPDNANDELLGLDAADDQPDFPGELNGSEQGAQIGHVDRDAENQQVDDDLAPAKKKKSKHNAATLDPAPVAARFVSHLGEVQNLVFWHDEFHQYTDGSHYRPLTPAELRAMAIRFINPKFSRLTGSITSNVVDQIKAKTIISGRVEPNTWLTQHKHDWPDNEILTAPNGQIRFTKIGAGMPRDQWCRPNTSRFFSLHSLAFPVADDAPEPDAWLSFLNELWPHDPQSIATLQDWFGYVLSGATALQKILLIVGPKRSGKGTIARTLAGMIGKHNIAGPTLSSLAGNFGLSPLLNKPLAIISDARLSGRIDQSIVVERFLSISGEDVLSVDRKFLSPVTCSLPTRLMIFSNELPRLGDSSGAMASRLILLRLTESFFGRENTKLTNQLLAELPGIFLWSIAGLRRLREHGRITQPESASDMVQDMESLGSPIGAFVRDRCCVNPGWAASTAACTPSGNSWCEENGRREPGTMATFGRDLLAAVPGLTKKQRRDDEGERHRVYEGLGILGQTSKATR